MDLSFNYFLDNGLVGIIICISFMLFLLLFSLSFYFFIIGLSRYKCVSNDIVKYNKREINSINERITFIAKDLDLLKKEKRN